MADPPSSRCRDVVLVGGGHAHLFVLRAFGRKPLPGIRLTLIAKDTIATYSGMLPGVLAGIYPPEASGIDLAALARFAGARLVASAATGIDPASRIVRTEAGEPIAYDVLSIDVGILPDVSAVAGAKENALLVKPISRLLAKWQTAGRDWQEGRYPQNAVVIGGGPAGFELANALRHRLARAPEGSPEPRTQVTLVAGDSLLAGLSKHGRRLGRRTLAEAGIGLVEGARAVEVAPRGVRLDDGRVLGADLVLVATAARPPAWLAATGLAVDEEGYLRVGATLQVEGSPEVFAAGDCVTLVGQERPKAGVFAVREGPILADNLRRFLTGRRLRRYRAQRRFLVLLSLADGTAITARNGLALRSRWAWWWKDRIDRRFVRQFGGDLQDRGRDRP
ncbi:FAD-dependent oxidoreductase [Jiella sp. M17.18]|uniref:FAD-dependent oxidoreductase n=1 Tax=Jiella sp. M17.18 TaxID=3234247 RepID=UPI0034DFBE41